MIETVQIDHKGDKVMVTVEFEFYTDEVDEHLHLISIDKIVQILDGPREKVLEALNDFQRRGKSMDELINFMGCLNYEVEVDLTGFYNYDDQEEVEEAVRKKLKAMRLDGEI